MKLSTQSTTLVFKIATALIACFYLTLDLFSSSSITRMYKGIIKSPETGSHRFETLKKLPEQRKSSFKVLFFLECNNCLY